jgi:hypothetical protein
MGYHSDVPEWAPEEEERTFTRAQFHHDDGLSGDPMFYWGGSFSDAAVYQSPWTDTEFNLTGWGTRSEPFETFGGLGTATGIWLEVICMQGTDPGRLLLHRRVAGHRAAPPERVLLHPVRPALGLLGRLPRPPGGLHREPGGARRPDGPARCG